MSLASALTPRLTWTAPWKRNCRSATTQVWGPALFMLSWIHSLFSRLVRSAAGPHDESTQVQGGVDIMQIIRCLQVSNPYVVSSFCML